MSEPWKEEDSAFVDSFFLPGGILDPEDEEDIGILSTLPTGQRIPSNPWGNEKFQSTTPSSPVSYLRAAKQYEMESASPTMFGERVMDESEPRVNSPLRSIVRPPPGYDGYVNGLASNSHLAGGVSPLRPNHSGLLSTNHTNLTPTMHSNRMSCQENGLVKGTNHTDSPNMRYELSQNYSTSTQHVHPVDASTAKGPSLSVPTLANDVNPGHPSIRYSKSDDLAKPPHPVNNSSTPPTLKTEAPSNSKHLVQNHFEPSVKAKSSKNLNQGGSMERVPERHSFTSSTAGTKDSLDATSHMTLFCDGEEVCSDHVPQNINSGAMPKEDDSTRERSQPESIDELHVTPTTHPAPPETEISKLGDKTNGQIHSDTTEQHASAIPHDTVVSSSFQETPPSTTRNTASILQGILRPFSLVFRMATLLLLDLPRKGANVVAWFVATACFCILSTVRRSRHAVLSVKRVIAHSVKAGVKQLAVTGKSSLLLSIHTLSLAPAFLAMMSKASFIQALEEPSSAFCYTVFYFLPSWCSSLAEHFDVPHWSAHFIITIAIYLVSHPVQAGTLHRGEFPVSEVVEALFRNGNYCDPVLIDKYERRAEVRKRNERICNKCLRILRCCLPIFCLIDGFSYDGATIIGDSGASRLTTAFMMSLVRRNLAFSPIGWVSWAVQVLVATYLDVWILRDTIVFLLGMSSFRLIRYLDQKRLKRKRKRR